MSCAVSGCESRLESGSRSEEVGAKLLDGYWLVEVSTADMGVAKRWDVPVPWCLRLPMTEVLASFEVKPLKEGPASRPGDAEHNGLKLP
jgi:hypothetical protein